MESNHLGKNVRSLRMKNFFHHCSFFFNCRAESDSNLFPVFGSKIQAHRKFVSAFFANKNNNPADRQYILIGFSFLEFLQDALFSPFLFLWERQFFSYAGFTRAVKMFSESNSFKHFLFYSNFPRSPLCKLSCHYTMTPFSGPPSSAYHSL